MNQIGRFMCRKLGLGLLLTCLSWPLLAQTGESVYQFLEFPTSTVAAANGGNTLASPVSDLNLVFSNPALLKEDMTQQWTFGYLNYLADINAGSLAYAGKINATSQWMAGIRYVDFGSMPWTSASNDLLGETTAQDLAFSGTYAWQLAKQWKAGGAFNLIYSVLDEYASFAVAVDLGVYYSSADNLFSAAMTLNHLGSQITAYDDTYESMPWDIRLGISKKLQYAPFRFNLTAQHLNPRSLSYLNGDEVTSYNWVQQIFTRLNGGVDFIPSEQFMLSIGYNYRRISELGIAQRTFFGGFSAGLQLRIKTMTVGASYARYHAGGNTLQMSLSLNNTFFGL
jgi:hypothetical protein